VGKVGGFNRATSQFKARKRNLPQWHNLYGRILIGHKKVQWHPKQSELGNTIPAALIWERHMA
jgi:hypothetical protein